jgi:hypothetical protein
MTATEAELFDGIGMPAASRRRRPSRNLDFLYVLSILHCSTRRFPSGVNGLDQFEDPARVSIDFALQFTRGAFLTPSDRAICAAVSYWIFHVFS